MMILNNAEWEEVFVFDDFTKIILFVRYDLKMKNKGEREG
jgi:hypothetical protein